MLVVVQPRSFQVTATKRRQITASWERPHEISYSDAWSTMACVVMLSQGDGARKKCVTVIELKLYLFIYLFYIIEKRNLLNRHQDISVISGDV